MRITQKHGIALALLSGFLMLTFVKSAQAVPAFARQMGTVCAACHFQNFPALNSFGRTFRANGYTMQGAQTMIQGDGLSLPSTLNASVIAKVRYQKLKEDDRGEIQWPDEAALLVGGRASNRAGFLLELGMGPGEAEVTTETDLVTGEGEGSGSTTGNFLSAKFHFMVGESFAIIPFSTDGLGVGYGYEMLNTGVQRSQRPIENRKGFSAAQALGTASGGATGIAVVYQATDFSLNYSHWAPTWGNVNANIFGGLANYIRAVYMPNIGGWDTGFGFSSMSGSVEAGANDPATEIFVDSWGIDAQAQGFVGDMTLGLYASYGLAPKSSATEENFYNKSTTDDASSLGLLAKLGISPETSVYLAYSSLDKNGDENTSSTFGVQYHPSQNIKIEAYSVSEFDSADDYTMLQLFAGF